MQEYRVSYTNEKDVLYSEDGLKSISPSVVFSEDREQVWSLEKGIYWLLRECSSPHAWIAYYRIEVTEDRVCENSDIPAWSLPQPLQKLIQNMPL